MTPQIMSEKFRAEQIKHRATIEEMKTQFLTRFSIFNIIYSGMLLLAFWLGAVIG